MALSHTQPRDGTFGHRHVDHRVHRIHDQIQNHLLQLNGVALDRQGQCGERAVLFDLLADREARKQIDRFPHNLVEIYVPDFEGCLLQKAPQAKNDIAGALLVPSNVGDDFPDCTKIGCVRFDHQLHCCRIDANGPERLIDLVRDRGRQLASRRETVDAREFRHSLPRYHFGTLPAPTLMQKKRDQERYAPALPRRECRLRLALPSPQFDASRRSDGSRRCFFAASIGNGTRVK